MLANSRRAGAAETSGGDEAHPRVRQHPGRRITRPWGRTSISTQGRLLHPDRRVPLPRNRHNSAPRDRPRALLNAFRHSGTRRARRDPERHAAARAGSPCAAPRAPRSCSQPTPSTAPPASHAPRKLHTLAVPSRQRNASTVRRSRAFSFLSRPPPPPPSRASAPPLLRSARRNNVRCPGGHRKASPWISYHKRSRPLTQCGLPPQADLQRLSPGAPQSSLASCSIPVEPRPPPLAPIQVADHHHTSYDYAP